MRKIASIISAILFPLCSLGNTSDCGQPLKKALTSTHLTISNVERFKLDKSVKSIPLRKGSNGFSGYEFRLSAPVFSNQDAVYSLVSKNHGEIHIMITNIIDYFDSNAFKDVPEDVARELVQFLKAVVTDANRRGMVAKSLTVFIRNELRFNRGEDGTRGGWAHRHVTKGLTYAKDEYGPQTEIDVKNRCYHLSEQEQESAERFNDYLTSHAPNSLVIFGSVWHRIPILRPGEKRLWIGVQVNEWPIIISN